MRAPTGQPNAMKRGFELNIRNVSGGKGLIVLADGVTPDPDVANFSPKANANRKQLSSWCAGMERHQSVRELGDSRTHLAGQQN
jgi:hypothetical protein